MEKDKGRKKKETGTPVGLYAVRPSLSSFADVTQTAGTSPPTPVVPALPALVSGQIRTIVILDRSGSGTPLTAAIYQGRNP